MKNYILILVSLLLFSCSDSNMKLTEQEIIDGKVSEVDEGHIGRFATLPRIWVQTPKQTRCVVIPFEYKNRWKVGDSCLLIIETYKVLDK